MTAVGSTRKPRSRLVRGIHLSLGLICLGFAYLSFLPGIPTVDFVVLAAFFFARSSDRFHDWLVHHRVFGRVIAGYRGGLTKRAKVTATIAILASLAVSGILLTDKLPVRVILALVGAYAVWFVWTRPAKPSPV